MSLNRSIVKLEMENGKTYLTAEAIRPTDRAFIDDIVLDKFESEELFEQESSSPHCTQALHMQNKTVKGMSAPSYPHFSNDK